MPRFALASPDGKHLTAFADGAFMDEQFKIRAKATDELQKLGELTLPLIDKALAGGPSPEAGRRLDELRGKLTGVGLQGEGLRLFRAVEVLERIATPESRRLLESLAGGRLGRCSRRAPRLR